MGEAVFSFGMPYFVWGSGGALRNAVHGISSDEQNDGNGSSGYAHTGYFQARLSHEAVISARRRVFVSRICRRVGKKIRQQE